MIAPARVQLVVLCGDPDSADALARILRDSGRAVHCRHVRSTAELAQALAEVDTALVAHCADDSDAEPAAVAELCARHAGRVALLAVRETLTAEQLASDLEAGARDTLTLSQPARVRAVAARELKALQTERELKASAAAIGEYALELQTLLERSPEPIAYVQEGIVVTANPAWCSLLGHDNAEEMAGLPLLDLFATQSRPGLTRALTAGAGGETEIEVVARRADGTELPLALTLQAVAFEGEPALRLWAARPAAASAEAPAAANGNAPPFPDIEAADIEAAHAPAPDGFHHRRAFFAAAAARLETPVRGGVRALLWLRPDKVRQLRDEVGFIESENLLDGLAELLTAQLLPADLPGRLGSHEFALLLERGTPRDSEVWCTNLLRQIGRHVFEAEQRSLSITCSLGLAQVERDTSTIDALIQAAEQACRRAWESGGNSLRVFECEGAESRTVGDDGPWVERIQKALAENRFKLIHQPIACLLGTDQGLYDMLLRMMDERGQEVLPAEFLPPAQRNGLMRRIDRFVMAASIAFLRGGRTARAFVRISEDTLTDETLGPWLQNLLRRTGAQPAQLCFQITEGICSHRLRETHQLVVVLQGMGFKIAIEHFGVGRDPLQLLQHLPVNYVKIDGALMQGLAGNELQQKRVRGLLEAARAKNIETIAERVEDANTIAVLFRLGVSYMQGYYVQEPEVVLSDPAPGTASTRLA